MMQETCQLMPSSLLRLLIDEEPDFPFENSVKSYTGFQDLKNDILNNLGMILNSRLTYLNPPPNLNEIRHSILNYGIVDFTEHYYSLIQNQRELCASIETAIIFFEPRLQSIRVSLLESELKNKRHLLIQIEALIQWSSEPRKAAFELELDLIQYQFSFEGENQK